MMKMGYSGKRPLWCPSCRLRTGKWAYNSQPPQLDARRLAKRFPGLSSLKYQLRHSDGRVRIWRKQHESMYPSCLVSTLQAAAGGVMGGIFLAHFGAFSTTWTSFKHGSLPEPILKVYKQHNRLKINLKQIYTLTVNLNIRCQTHLLAFTHDYTNKWMNQWVGGWRNGPSALWNSWAQSSVCMVRSQL